MKIVMVTNFFEGHRGGVEIVAGRLARELVELGDEICWVAADADAPPRDADFRTVALSTLNITEHRLGFPYPLTSLKSLWQLATEVRRADTLFLHDSLCMPSISAFLSAKIFGKPIVLVQHIGEIPYDNIIMRALMKLGDRVVTRYLLRIADQVVFISQATMEFYRDIRFRRAPRLVFNGVDMEVFFPKNKANSDSQAGLRQRPSTALFVGRFVEKKGLDLIRRVAEARPDMSWVMAGWGPLDPEAWRLPNVQVVRGRSGAGLAELYRSSDVLVLPSRGEGFPLVLQEALACGLPVICGEETLAADPSAASSMHGVVVTGDKPEAAQRLASMIDHVLAQGRSHDMERVRFAQARYAWPEAARRYSAIFKALASPCHPRIRPREREGLSSPLRYLGVGGLCAAMNNAILIGGTALGLHLLPLLVLSFTVVGMIGYAAHCRFTFVVSPSWEAFARYMMAMLVNLPLSFLLLGFGNAMGLPMMASAPSPPE